LPSEDSGGWEPGMSPGKATIAFWDPSNCRAPFVWLSSHPVKIISVVFFLPENHGHLTVTSFDGPCIQRCPNSTRLYKSWSAAFPIKMMLQGCFRDVSRFVQTNGGCNVPTLNCEAFNVSKSLTSREAGISISV
jgi:hypothetical protein